MKTAEQIQKEIAGLHSRLISHFEPYFKAEALHAVLEAKIASKIVDTIDAVVGTYSIAELVLGAEAAAEIAMCDVGPEDDPN